MPRSTSWAGVRQLLTATLLLTAAACHAPDLEADMAVAEARWVDQGLSRSLEMQLQYEQHFRSKFDFLAEDTASTVRDMAHEDLSPYGAFLSDPDRTELERRMAIRPWFDDVVAAAVGPDYSEELIEGLAPGASFGALAGYWVDNLDGSRLQLALTADHPLTPVAREAAEAKIDELVADGAIAQDDVRIFEAPYSLDEIYKVNADFAAQYLDGVEHPERIRMSVSINVRDNVADLYVEPGWEDEAWRFALRHEPGLVNVVYAEAGDLSTTEDLSTRADWGLGNWHAGAQVRVKKDASGGDSLCTWGASAKTSTYSYIVLAAHCYGHSQGSVGSYWNSDKSGAALKWLVSYAGNDTLSPKGSGFVRYYNSTRGDIMTVSTQQHVTNDDYDCYFENKNLCGRLISGRALTGDSMAGDWVWAALGRTDAYLGFEIVTHDAPLSGRDFMRELDSNSGTQGGDSGAGFKNGSKMHGIYHGRRNSNDNAIFTHAYYVEDSAYLGRTICGSGGNCDN